jgi:DNA-binding transcriptional MerR regulator
MSISAKELRRRGVSDEDMRTARIIQEAQRRQGVPVKTLGQIFSGQRATEPTKPADLTERQLRKRGRIGQAALLLDQEALTDPDFIRKNQLRFLAHAAKELAHIPKPLEYDFFKGNWSVADQYYDTIRDRIHALDMPLGKRAMATAVLTEIIRWLPWQEAACSKTAAEIADLLKARPKDISEALQTLEQVGAIRRVARGRTKLIYVNPEGAYRGRVDNHAKAVDAYKETMAKAGNVIPLRGEP